MTVSPYILRPVESLDYYHTASAELPVALSPLDAWNLMTAEPQPLLRLAFQIRDTISAWFGVKRIGGFTRAPKTAVLAGDHIDFFLVERVEPDALVLTARDRHLDVMTTLTTSGRRLTVTSSVVTHNFFGRVYMLPVGIAHKIIVTTMLGRLQKRLVQQG